MKPEIPKLNLRGKVLYAAPAVAGGGLGVGLATQTGGFWRKLPAGQKGKDRNGQPIKGKTWVKFDPDVAFSLGLAGAAAGGGASYLRYTDNLSHLGDLASDVVERKRVVRKSINFYRTEARRDLREFQPEAVKDYLHPDELSEYRTHFRRDLKDLGKASIREDLRKLKERGLGKDVHQKYKKAISDFTSGGDVPRSKRDDWFIPPIGIRVGPGRQRHTEAFVDSILKKRSQEFRAKLAAIPGLDFQAQMDWTLHYDLSKGLGFFSSPAALFRTERAAAEKTLQQAKESAARGQRYAGGSDGPWPGGFGGGRTRSSSGRSRSSSDPGPDWGGWTGWRGWDDAGGNRKSTVDDIYYGNVDEHLKTLGISKDTKTKKEAKNAYRAFMKKHHPDRGGDPEKAKKGTTAWSALENSTWFQKLAFINELRSIISGL